MKSVTHMIRTGDIAGAASAVYDGLYRMIEAVPGMKITKKEFEKVTPVVAQKMAEPESVVEEVIDLGDMVKLAPSKAELVITFVGPTDDPAFKGPEPYRMTYAIGDDFVFIAPVIEGYVASPSDVEGTMDANGVQLEISYSKVSNPPLYGMVSVINGNREVATDKGTVVNKAGDEAWVYFEGEMDWNRTVSDVNGEEHETWMAGFRIDAPAELKEESDFASVYMELVKDDGGSNSGRLLFTKTQNAEQKEGHYNNIWLLLDQDKMQTALDNNIKLSWTASFDWNGDGGYEQVVHLVVDPTKVTLAEHDGECWPPKEPELEQVKVEPVNVEEAPAKKSKKKKKAE